MKAIVCNEFAPLDKLEYKDVADPTPGPDQVVVKVKAAGVNFLDVLIVQGLYQVKPELPFTPGMEFSGEIVAVGDNVKDLSPGSRVLGLSQSYGAFADLVACPAGEVYPIPDDIPFADASVLGCAFGTAQHAFGKRAQLKPGETVAIMGAAGGTGTAAIQVAKAMGAKVIAVCSTQEKLDVARENGADELINYNEQDLRAELKSITGGKGVDVAYDTVGGDAFKALSRSMARMGRLIVIGFASGDIPQFPVNLALVKEYSLVGAFWGNYVNAEPDSFRDDLKELFQWYKEGKIKPVIDREVPLAQGVDALQLMQDRKVKGKLVVAP